MIQHVDLGDKPFARSRALWIKIQSREITLGGNRKLKIYGRLDCNAGKRMKVVNRVFFENDTEAIENAYRPCAVCMRNEYLLWKKNTIKPLPFPNLK